MLSSVSVLAKVGKQECVCHSTEMRKCDLASITSVIEIGISIGFLIMLQNLVLMYTEEHQADTTD